MTGRRRPPWLARDEVNDRLVMAGHGLDEPEFSPACANSRHPTCDGWAWDHTTDRRCACECTCHDRG